MKAFSCIVHWALGLRSSQYVTFFQKWCNRFNGFIYVSHINFLGRLFAFKDHNDYNDYGMLYYLHQGAQKNCETLYPAQDFLLTFLLLLLSDCSTVTWHKMRCYLTILDYSFISEIPRSNWKELTLARDSFLSKHRVCHGYRMSQSCVGTGCRSHIFLLSPAVINIIKRLGL